MKTLLFLFVGIGLLSIIIALPLIMRLIKPNPFYGFRIQRTLEDPQVWYSVNEYFARHLLIVGILHVFASIAFFFIPGISVDIYALSCMAVFVILFSRAMSQSFRYIKSLN